MPNPARARRLVLLIAALATLTFGAGMAARVGCTDPCASDIAYLYTARGVRPDAPPYLARDLEYPVVVGAAFYLATAVAHDPLGFYLASAALLGAAAIGVGVMLARRTGARAWWWALAPPLALYGVQNWDLLAVAPAVGGLLAAEGGAFTLAGVLLAIGASAKIYPGMFVAVVVADRLAARDRRGARSAAAAAIVTTLVLNLPVLLAAPHGWLFPFRFQSRREATWGSLWPYVSHLPGLRPWLHDPLEDALVDVATALALVAGASVVLRRVWRRALSPIPAAAVMTTVFLLANKIYSPQYDLWLVPFFVLLATPRARVVWFMASDAAVFVMTHVLLGHVVPGTPLWRWVLLGLVVSRASAVVALARGWMRPAASPPAVRPVAPDEPVELERAGGRGRAVAPPG